MKNISTDIIVYKNLIRGKLLGRRIEIVKFKEDDTIIIGFRKLVQIKEDGFKDFISTPAQKLLSRPHSNYGILISTLKISSESASLVAQMLNSVHEIISYKHKSKK